MPLSLSDITDGWADRPPLGAEIDEARCQHLATLPVDDNAIDAVVGSLRSAVATLSDVDVEVGTATLDVLVPLIRRHVDALEGELARLMHTLALHSMRPETGPRSTAAEIARRAGCAQRRAALSGHIGREIGVDHRISDTLRDAEISLDNARVLAEVAELSAFDEAADRLLDAARELTPGRLRQVIDGWLASIPAEVDETDDDPSDDAGLCLDVASELERRRRDARTKRFVSFASDRYGMTRISGLIPREDATLVSRMVTDIASLSADDSTDRTWPQRMADALVEWATLSEGQLRTNRQRPVVVIARSDVLDGQVHGAAHRSDGEVLTTSDIDRNMCIGDRRELALDMSGAPMSLGRRRRTFTTAQYLALARRDGRCRYPGCETPPDRCEAHHIREFANDHGPTDLDNGILLCPTHHRHLHQLSERFVGDPEADLVLIDSAGVHRTANPPLLRHDPPTRPTRRSRNEERVRQRLRVLRQECARPSEAHEDRSADLASPDGRPVIRPPDGTSRARRGRRRQEEN